jgi:hypothetical protein
MAAYHATGTKTILEVNRKGNIIRRLDTGLEGNHLMQFVLNHDNSKLYSVGSCGYAKGYSALNLSTGKIEKLRKVETNKETSPGSLSDELPCGEFVELVSESILAVGKTMRTVPQDIEGAITFIDINTANIIRKITLPSEPVDTFYLMSK